MVDDLDYEGIKFPVSKKDYCKIERQNYVCINTLCMKTDWLILFMYQIKSFIILWICC